VADPIITKEQAIAKLGQAMFTRIFDDNNDSAADKLSEEQMRADASDRVRGKLGPIYNPDLLTQLTASQVGEIRRITLDNFKAMCADRRPTIVKQDPEVLFLRADRDLKDLRSQLANLGTNLAPEPAANVGCTVTSGNPDDPCPGEMFALNGTGDY
jgi:hypothetical protein